MADLVLIHYPSGGFGHTLFHILTKFSEQTFKPGHKSFQFGSDGNGHSANIYTEKYMFHPKEFNPTTPVTDKTVLILCDTGLTDDTVDPIIQKFPDSKILRLVIDQDVRPVIYQTCSYKAEQSTPLVSSQRIVNANWVEGCEDYAIREQISLFYHSWSFGWEPIQHSNIINVSIQQLIDSPVAAIEHVLKALNHNFINYSDLENFCNDWLTANQRYFQVYYEWKRICWSLDNQIPIDLSHITDLHDQGYLNYCIEQKFNVTIPVYDYRDWFKSTSDILLMVQDVQNKNTYS